MTQHFLRILSLFFLAFYSILTAQYKPQNLTAAEEKKAQDWDGNKKIKGSVACYRWDVSISYGRSSISYAWAGEFGKNECAPCCKGFKQVMLRELNGLCYKLI